MFFWFAGLTFAMVAWVFASPAIDYRLVIVGSVFPVLEMIFGGPWFLHTLLAPVMAMTIVMLALRGQRLKQRRWLGIAIGLFFYLVLDGAWTRTTLFWWPLFGFEVESGDIPTWEPLGVLLVMEAIGLAAAAWVVHRYRLAQPDERALFKSEGRLSRAAMGPPPGQC